MPTIELEFEPRAGQYSVLKALRRFNVLVCHRRWGKTVLCINKLIAEALRCPKERPRFAYLSPFYRQSKTIAWDYLKHYTRPIPGVQYNESELRVDFPNGARITLYGADNPDSLRGIYLDGVVLDEFAQMSPKAWTEVLRPALADRKGWAIFIGTPMGHNAFYDLYQNAQSDTEWYAGMFKASETGVIDPNELNAARRDMSPDEYAQEFECSFEAAIQGAYYADEIRKMREDGRTRPVEYDPLRPVYTAWDLGINDTTPIIFYQNHPREVAVIDYEEHNGEGLGFYAQLLRDKHYDYGGHFLPHDAESKTLQTGRTTRELLEELGVYPITVAPRLPVLDGIHSVRQLFPRLVIHQDQENPDERHLRCQSFIDAISQYRKEYDDTRRTFRSIPLHDWASHPADALRYLAITHYDEPLASGRPSLRDDSGGRLAA